MRLLRFFDRCKGSVSILLAIILLPTLMLSGLLVDLANRNMSKAIVEEAGELAAASVLARYDTVLEDVYGIFAVSQTYTELQANVMKYMEDTISAAGYLEGEANTEMKSRLMKAMENQVNSLFPDAAADAAPGLIRASVSNVSAGGVASTTLSQSAVLENQIVEFMKYRGPAEVGLDLLSTLNAFGSVNDQSVVAESKTTVDEKMGDLGKDASELYRALVQLDEFIEEVQDATPEAGEWSAVRSALDGANKIVVGKLHDTADIDPDKMVFVSDTSLSVDDWTLINHDFLSDYPLIFAQDDLSKITETARELDKYVDITDFTKEDSGTVQAAYEAYNTHMKNVIALLKGLHSIKENIAKEEEKPEDKQDAQKLSDLRLKAETIMVYLKEDYTMKAWDNVGARLKTYGNKIDLEDAYSELGGYLSVANGHLNPYKEAVKNIVERKDPGFFSRIGKALTGKDTSYIAYVIELTRKIETDIAAVDTANKQLDRDLEEYKGKNQEDSYYTNMSAQAQVNKSLFTENDMPELRGQLEAIRDYLEDVLDQLNAGSFYEKDFPQNNVGGKNYGKKAQEVLKQAAESDPSFARGASGLEQRARNTYVQVMEEKKPMSANSYLKLVMSKAEIDGVSYPIPHACLTLAAQYGGEKENNNLDKNLKKSVKTQADESDESGKDAANTAAGMSSPYDYVYTIFDEAGEGNSGVASKGNREDVSADDASGAIKQLRSMISLVKGMLSVLGDLATGKLENFRDDLLITEYIRENFSSYYNTTEGYQKEVKGHNDVVELDGLSYPTTMTGVMIAPQNNAIFGCEQEYILYGYKGSSESTGILFWKETTQTGPSMNVDLVKGNIYAIRLVCNAIFALTDSQLDQETIPPAAAIQAATAGVFPMQLAQVILKLGLALLETSLDMNKIMKGEKVPLFKNSQTWQCSLQGMINTLKTEAVAAATQALKDATEAAVSELSGRLDSLISDGIDAVTNKVGDIASDVTNDVTVTVNGMVDEAISSVSAALTSKARELINQIFLETDSANQVTEAEMKAQLNSAVNDAIQGLNVDQSVKNLLQKVFNSRGQNLVDKIWNADTYHDVNGTEHKLTFTKPDGAVINPCSYGRLLVELRNAAADPNGTATALVDGCVNKAASVVAETIKTHLNLESVKKQIDDEVNSMLSDLSSELKSKSSELIRDAASGAEDAVNDCIDEMSNKVSEKLDELFPGTSLSIGEGGNMGDVTEVDASGNTAKTFMAGYDDYLLVFLFLGVCNHDEHNGIVARIGEVMGMNLRGSGADEAKKGGMQAYRTALKISDDKYQDKAFTSSKAYTYISISCDVTIRPVLLSQKLIMQGRTEEVSGSSFWTYTYSTIAGY